MGRKELNKIKPVGIDMIKCRWLNMKKLVLKKEHTTKQNLDLLIIDRFFSNSYSVSVNIVTS